MLKIFNSIPDNQALTELINDTYGLRLSDLYLYRDMIGSVYFLREKDKRYVFKLYRTFDTAKAILSTQVIDYLMQRGFPVAAIIPTKQDRLYTNIEMPEGNRVGILFEFIEGKAPDRNEDIAVIGRLTGKMHNIMESYPGVLAELGKEHYAERFIKLMRRLYSDQGKVNAMEIYANELWEHLQELPKGFCHGDLHAGNLLKKANGEIVFFDFDIASSFHMVFDAAIICNETGFRTLDAGDIQKTRRTFEKFYAGYSKERSFSGPEINAIDDCIALHHNELNGTIPLYRLPVLGNHWLSEDDFDTHYAWMMQWKNNRKF